MSWLRIEGRMPLNQKISALSDAAFRLYVTASCWCVDEQTDGLVPAHVPETLPRAPKSKAALTRVLGELVAAGVWEAQEDGSHIIHDFLMYNPSAAESKAVREAKVAAGAAGGRAKANGLYGKRLAAARGTGKQLPENEPGKTVADDKQEHSSRAGTRGRSDSESDSESQITTATEEKPGWCPATLPLDDDDFAALELDVGIPRNVAEVFLRRWAADERAAKSNPRILSAWVKCGLKALRGQWSDGSKRAEIRAMASPLAVEPPKPGEELRWV